MPRNKTRLSALQIGRIKEPGKHHTGEWLYLQVSTTGTRSWAFRYSRLGKARWMGLGPYPIISIAEARAKVLSIKKDLSEGVDPIVQRKNLIRFKYEAEARKVNFADCAAQYINSHKKGWKNQKHIAQWENTIATYASPLIGNIPVSEVDTAMVLKILEPIWQTKTETASRIQGRIENILSWATVRGYREGVNPAQWRGHLDQLLPSKTRVHTVKHFKALPFQEVSDFMERLRGLGGTTQKALEFLILTATRTSETLGARWDEINEQEQYWLMPKERIKTRVEVKIPLCPRAMSLLGEMKPMRVSDFVFPGRKPQKPLSNMALLKVHRRMGYKIDTHGFRSTFSDWAAEKTNFSREVVEMALAHTIGNKVEASYRRGDLFEKRRKLMETWAVFCSTPYAQKAHLIPLPGAEGGPTRTQRNSIL